MSKRLLDVAVAALGLLLLWPLMVVIVVAIRVDSRGPALFRQVRVARGGGTFKMLKFRTMQAASAGPLITAVGDRRVTRVGALLRQSKLDELPQLLNVLAGDMSLVGPRPEVPLYVEMYPPELRLLILSVRPGITDEASIEFRDESALLAGASDVEKVYVNEILPRKLELYARYARNHSVRGDLGILRRTILLLLKRG